MTKVFGHKSPDTDATCSAIVWSWYLNEHTSKQAEAFILAEINTETSFVLNRWNVPTPPILESLSENDSVVIVDTNNPQELPDDISNATIVQIIDHHKLTGGLETLEPIHITMRPLACTATVLYDLMGETVSELPQYISGLILSSILSDTLEFRSPTTTPHDKDLAEKLAIQLKINLSDYANEMFAAKSDVSGFSDIGLIKMDSKKYDIGGMNFRISVLETTTPQTILDRKDGLMKAIIECIKEEKDVDEVLLFVIDILQKEATVFTYNDLTKKVIGKSFGVTVENDTEILPGIMSRKKQIIPLLKM